MPGVDGTVAEGDEEMALAGARRPDHAHVLLNRHPLEYQEETRALARQHGLRGLAVDLINGLIARPLLATGWVASVHG